MARTSNVYVRLEPKVKEQSEAILSQLGMPMSSAIALFLQQVILQRGLPFEVKLPQEKPIAYESLSDEQFNSIIKQGLDDYANGEIYSAQQVKEIMRKELMNEI